MMLCKRPVSPVNAAALIRQRSLQNNQRAYNINARIVKFGRQQHRFARRDRGDGLIVALQQRLSGEHYPDQSPACGQWFYP